MHKLLSSTVNPSGPTARESPRVLEYIVALTAATVAVLIRLSLRPVLGDEHPFVVPLLAVIFVAWLTGFWPALLTLAVVTTGVLYFFVSSPTPFVLERTPDQVGVALFFFGGIACALLGESQRRSRRRADLALSEMLARQTELRASEDRFRTLAEAVPQIVWVTRPNGHHEYYNPRWYDYTGLTVEESLGHGWTKPLHPDDLERSRQRWWQSTATGEVYEIEYRFRRSDGVYRWFLGRALPVRDEQGKVIRWFGTCTDIHDKKQLEEDLRQAADRFRLLMEALPGLVWTSAPTGEVTYFNKHYTDYAGVTLENGPDGWREPIHPDDLPGLVENWREAIATGRPCTYEYRIRRKSDGEYRWHLSHAVPLRDSSGVIIQWIGAITDIDSQRRQAEHLERLVRDRTAKLREEIKERLEAEQKVAEMMAELRRSNGELEQFAYVASHDLQEPLRKIQAFGGRLVARCRDNLGDQGRDYVDRMQNSASRMQQLINDLLVFSRVATHGQEFRPVDLGVIASEVISDLEDRILQTEGEVHVGELPVVQADPSQMRQLFQNLIGNALKFHRPGVAPRVEVSARLIDQPGRAVHELSVSDNGIGFEEQYLDRIFQVFQRLHGRGVYEGTGVGLAICKKIVERHGGSITARSKPGEGSTFLVQIPADPNARNQAVSNDHEKQQQAHYHTDGRR